MNQGESVRSFVGRLAGVGLVAVLAVVSPAGTALASTAPDRPAADAVLVRRGSPLPIPEPPVDRVYNEYANHLWTWSTGGRGYLLTEPEVGGNYKPYQSITMMDLDTGALLARERIQPTIWNDFFFAGGLSHTMVVDEASGILYAYFVDPGPLFTGTSWVDNRNGPARCALGSGAAGAPYCAGGIVAIDADTLAVRDVFPFRLLNLDAPMVSVMPRALAFAPADEVHDRPKILALVEDMVHNQHQATPNGAEYAIPRRTGNGSVVYAIQIDAETGLQDWAVRLEACRGAREPRASERQDTTRPNPAAIFRSQNPSDRAVWVGCHGASTNQLGIAVRIPLDEAGNATGLPVAAASDVGEIDSPGGDEPGADPSTVVRQNPAHMAFPGPEKVMEILADPGSSRLLMKVIDRQQEVWWVFDGNRREYLGTIGIGAYSGLETTTGLDPTTGRFYVLAPSTSGFGGGLLVTNVRSTPVAQALVFPDFADLALAVPRSLSIWSRSEPGRPVEIFVPTPSEESFRRILDAVPGVVEQPTVQDFGGRTLDLVERDGVTHAAFDGVARGYGVRALLMGGAEGAARVGPVDALGNYHGLAGTVPQLESCSEINREIILAMVGPSGPAVVDASGGRASAEPVVVDSSTRADSEAPISRCLSQDWERLWTTALFGRPPVAEPTLPWFFGEGQAACVGTTEPTSGSFSDSLLGGADARANCAPEEVSGFSQIRGANVEGVSVAQSLSTFRVYRDPGRGIVARIDSVARGIDLGGGVRIASIRGSAESWANGRRQPVPAAERPVGYVANCDMERSAGTCFQRHLFGLTTPMHSCGPCGDEARFLDLANRALGTNGRVRLREPDPVLARGAENGFIAAIQKTDHERFGDLVLSNDLLQTVLPTLELVRYSSANRLVGGGGGPRGRQIFQFAGVEVSSSYGIACLLVYDETANTCAEVAEPPGSMTVSLADVDGTPLAGGAFEVRSDVDADGVLGLADTLLPEGACVTTDDGVGTCSFEGLAPGGYLVNQVAAPPGYAKSGEPFVVELASGEARTVAFTNVSNVSSIELQAADEAGAPLAGASFAAYPDPDSDGKVAPEAAPAAECTTDAQGACSMQVPAGSYVLVQTAAPAGLEGIEPVPFTFASGGQVAAVSVVNYPPDSPAQPDAPASPVYTPPVDVVPPTQIVGDYVPPVSSEPQPEIAPDEGFVDQVGGTVVQVIRAPGDALRLLSRDPKQAVAWTAALALFALAALAVRRRQHALALIEN